MSSRLCFRKKEVNICSFSSNSEIYEACRNSHMIPYDKWEVVTRGMIFDVIDELEEDIRSKEKSIKVHREIMKGNLDYEGLFSAASTIVDFTEDIEKLKNDVTMLQLLSIIEEEGNYNEEAPLEWRIL